MKRWQSNEQRWRAKGFTRGQRCVLHFTTYGGFEALIALILLLLWSRWA